MPPAFLRRPCFGGKHIATTRFGGDKVSRFVTLVVLLLAIYAGSYAFFRQTNQEVWPKDKQTYVMFNSGALGHALDDAWRSVSYSDSTLSGMRFHVGPHR